MDEPKQIKRKEDAPFNFAIATLMRIDLILKDIKEVSFNIATGASMGLTSYGDSIDQPELLSAKLSLTRQLYLNASPLLGKYERKLIKDKIDKLKVNYKEYNMGNHLKPEFITILSYDYETEIKIEEIIEEIELEMQKKGAYFMPRKDDPRFASRRE